MLFAIEIDRKGDKDAVFYDCDNKEFTEFVTKEYFRKEYGSYTDICEICPAINCAGVNISSGYYNQHTKNESINISEMDSILIELEKLIERGIEDNQRYEFVQKAYSLNGYAGYYDDYDYYYYLNRVGGSKKYLIINDAMFDYVEIFALSKEKAVEDYLTYYDGYEYGLTKEDIKVWEVI